MLNLIKFFDSPRDFTDWLTDLGQDIVNFLSVWIGKTRDGASNPFSASFHSVFTLAWANLGLFTKSNPKRYIKAADSMARNIQKRKLIADWESSAEETIKHVDYLLHHEQRSRFGNTRTNQTATICKKALSLFQHFSLFSYSFMKIILTTR